MQSQTISEAAQTQWWRLGRVIAETGLSRATIYRLMSRGQFPKNRALRSARATVWLETEIAEWKQTQISGEPAAGIGDLL